ncbi:MAG: phosphotransferase family protein [Acidimicrobiia bacterium]|nr:phosphotransferase family protein [Acidimicrobiia bacterium]
MTADVEPGADAAARGDVFELPGLAFGPVTSWLLEHVEGTVAPFAFDIIAGGHSNLTYLVTAADGARFVLRRPPLHHRLASAHDVGREHRIIRALRDSAVPVPRALAYCADHEVTGAPFFVMAFVDGHVVRDQATATRALTPPARALASESLVDTLAAIHGVDVAAAGLADLSRHDGYIARQLARWYGQWNLQHTRELREIDEVHAELTRRIPDQGPATIVHGDFRLDNCIVTSNGDVAAVLDWEICTLGDPLADVGLLQVYWTGPDDEPSAWAGQATAIEGFWNRAGLVDRYAAVSGRDVADLDFYVAFGYWKLACILEGVYARYLGGALGARDPTELAPFAEQITSAARTAAALLERS